MPNTMRAEFSARLDRLAAIGSKRCTEDHGIVIRRLDLPMTAEVLPASRRRLPRLFRGPVLIFVSLLSSQLAQAQFTQQGQKLVGTGTVAVGNNLVQQGTSVALSADGNTAIVGGAISLNLPSASEAGAAVIYVRNGSAWTQQGTLIGQDATGGNAGWFSAALSADGNTAILGYSGDNGNAGAAWVFTRSNGMWNQQGSKLVGTGAVGTAYQGQSVALSADGNTAIVGGYEDNFPLGGGDATGAAWVFTRSGGVWTQQGNKLVGSGAVGGALQGQSVALSADGNTAMVGGPGDNSNTGAVWLYTRSGTVWTQQGNKLVGTGAVGGALQGDQIALSADGGTAIVGGPSDNSGAGAAWVFTRSGTVWTQQGNKLVGTGAVGVAGSAANQGQGVTLSADGNTAIVGGPGDNNSGSGPIGAAWVFTRSGSIWTQQGNKLVGSGAVGTARQGFSVALSGDSSAAIVGGYGDDSNTGAAWVFVQPILPSMPVTPTANMVVAGNPGGPFAPASFQYQIRATVGSINYLISGLPSWLTPSSTSGTASSNTTVTFTVNPNANNLAVGTYGPTTITFTNSDTGHGTQTRTATLTVNPPGLLVSPLTGVAFSGTHGGPFSPSSFHYDLSSTYGSVNYSIANLPTWLTASHPTGTVTTSPKTVTFKVNGSAHALPLNTYIGSIGFTNGSTGQGNTTRVATLTVNPKDYKLTVRASPVADGTVTGGGEIAEGSPTTVTATPKAGFHFVHWMQGGQPVSTSSTYTFTMPSKAVTLNADFQKN
jgi:phosphotransferase system HPr-like phosphotransfer protein